jgi:hypothetical protein
LMSEYTIFGPRYTPGPNGALYTYWRNRPHLKQIHDLLAIR